MKNLKVILLTSNHCQPCKPMHAIIKKLIDDKEFPESCEVEFVNADSKTGAKYTAKNFIKGLPALIIMKKEGESINFSTKQTMIGLYSINVIKETVWRFV